MTERAALSGAIFMGGFVAGAITATLLFMVVSRYVMP